METVAPTGFTAVEIASLSNLRAAQRATRNGLLAFEILIGNSAMVTLETRQLFGQIEHALGEADEKLVNGTFYLLGAAAEPDDKERDKLRGLPRAEFVRRALREIDGAGPELVEARVAIGEAQELKAEDATYQLQLSRTIFYADQTSAKLADFDRALGYESPGGATLIQDEGFEALGQYGYQVADLLISAWADGPLFPDYRVYAAVLSQFWLVQQLGMDVCFRAAGVIPGSVGDSLRDILGGGISGINQRLNNMGNNLIKLDGTRAGRPSFDAAWLRAVGSKYPDLWRHVDRMAGALLIQGLV